MKARDLMVPIQAFLKPDDGLKEFVITIRNARGCEETRGVRSLPVIDASGKLVGVLSMKDILKATYPPYLYDTELSLFTWDGMLESMAKHVVGKRVSDLMTKPVITVKDDHPLMECVDHMLKYQISTIPVTDHGGRFLGMLYESDLFFAIAGNLPGVEP